MFVDGKLAQTAAGALKEGSQGPAKVVSALRPFVFIPCSLTLSGLHIPLETYLIFLDHSGILTFINTPIIPH